MATEPVRSALRCVIYPVWITTSPNIVASSAITTSILLNPFTAFSCVAFPINENTRISLSEFTSTEYSPFRFVIVPFEVPFTDTFTPISGSPVSFSVTVPVMTFTWLISRLPAYAIIVPENKTTTQTKSLLNTSCSQSLPEATRQGLSCFIFTN